LILLLLKLCIAGYFDTYDMLINSISYRAMF